MSESQDPDPTGGGDMSAEACLAELVGAVAGDAENRDAASMIESVQALHHAAGGDKIGVDQMVRLIRHAERPGTSWQHVFDGYLDRHPDAIARGRADGLRRPARRAHGHGRRVRQGVRGSKRTPGDRRARASRRARRRAL